MSINTTFLKLFFRIMVGFMALASFAGFAYLFVLGIIQKQLSDYLVSMLLLFMSFFFAFAVWRLDKKTFWSCHSETPPTYVSF